MRSRPPKGAACPAPDNIRQRFARGVAAGMAGAPRPDPATADLATVHGWRVGRNASGASRGGRRPELTPALARAVWREIEAIALADVAVPPDASPKEHWAWPGRS